MKRLLITLAALAALAALAGGSVVLGGLYDVSATDPHLAPTYRLLDLASRRAIARRAEGIPVPALDGEATIERGLALYRGHCVQCHGAPGVAPESFALGLMPAPANLAHTGRAWSPAEIYWVVRNGMKMTGMPAWEFRLSEEELWAVVAFIRSLPALTPEAYRKRAAAVTKHARDSGPLPAAGGDPARGKRAIEQYACGTCHRIPGIVGPNAPVGPPLDGIGSRGFIAGLLINEPAQMARWLRAPQSVSPLTAMPDLGVGERDAQDMAAYLATLK